MRRQITVTVADSHVAQIDDLAHTLRDAGLKVDGVLDAIGVITGSLPAEQRLQSIGSLPGVAAVEEQATFQIAPPDADVQ